MPHVNQHFHTIVVGAGGVGSATALELAKRGRRVLLLEQHHIPHMFGSSHGHSRIFRFAYDTPEYARLAQAALHGWHALEALARQPLLLATGGLDFGPAESVSLQNTLATLREVGASVEELSGLQLMRRFGQFRVPPDWLGLHSLDAGILNPSLTVELMATLAQGFGATVLEQTQVTQIDVAGLTVETSRGRFGAESIVVAAGAWLPQLLPDLKLPIEVTEESLAYFQPTHPELFTPERCPIFIEHGTLVYGFPMVGMPGVKVGLHHAGRATLPETRDYEASRETLLRLRSWMETRMPKAAGAVMQTRTCLYTNTKTHDFVLDTHPEQPALVIASPCSGHGFKFVPLLGEMIADLASGTRHALLSSRFAFGNALYGAGGPSI